MLLTASIAAAFQFAGMNVTGWAMNAIAGFTELSLKDTADPEKMAEYLEKIRISSTHLLVLINDVVEMNRIEGGKLTLHRESVNIPQLLTKLQSLASGMEGADWEFLLRSGFSSSPGDIWK